MRRITINKTSLQLISSSVHVEHSGLYVARFVVLAFLFSTFANNDATFPVRQNGWRRACDAGQRRQQRGERSIPK